MPRTPPLRVYGAGTWLSSGAGVSFACKCGWRSGFCDGEKAAAEALWRHIDKEHAPHDLPTSSVPAEIPDPRRARQPWEFFDD
jgi:hypothetical protein